MQLKVQTVEEYISQIPDDKREAFSLLRTTILENLPNGFVEKMSYGMIGYVIPFSIYPNGYHCNPKLPLIQLRKVFHNENYQISLFFGFDEELKIKAKSIGASWSQTHKCWYVLYNKENYNLINSTFDDVEIVKDKNNERHTEPAFIEQETVHIADVISEIQPTLKAEHKGTVPEIASKMVYLGNTGKYWILKIPYKKGITPKLMDIKGVYWNKTQKAFFVLRHVNVKIKVEALLSIGEIFPAEYFNLETVVSNPNTFIELNEYAII